MGSAGVITSLVIGGVVVGAIRLAEGASVIGDVVGLAEPENASPNELGGRVGGDIRLAEGASVAGDVVGLAEPENASPNELGGRVGRDIRFAEGASVVGDVVGLAEPENASLNELGGRVGGDIRLVEGANVIGDAVGLAESGVDVIGGGVGGVIGLDESGASVIVDVIGGGVGGVIGLDESGAGVMGDVVGLIESGAGVMGDAVGLVESGADVVGGREVHESNATHGSALPTHALAQSPSSVYVIPRSGGQYHRSTQGSGLGGAVCCFVARECEGEGGGTKNLRMRGQCIVMELRRDHPIISVIQIAPCIQLTACMGADDGACTRSTSTSITKFANRGIFVCDNFLRPGGADYLMAKAIIAALLREGGGRVNSNNSCADWT